MFLSRLGEKSGLFGILAPRRRKHGHAAQEASIDENEQRQASNNQDNGDHLPINNTNESKRAKKVSDARERQQTSQDYIIRKRRLDAQQKAETEAESRGAFCKKQRVKYHNKLLGKWDDAVIVGVHYDDGPDKPYYTIRYQKEEADTDEDGNAETKWVNVEKQTTSERLLRVPFDPDASWELLK